MELTCRQTLLKSSLAFFRTGPPPLIPALVGDRGNSPWCPDWGSNGMESTPDPPGVTTAMEYVWFSVSRKDTSWGSEQPVADERVLEKVCVGCILKEPCIKTHPNMQHLGWGSC